MEEREKSFVTDDSKYYITMTAYAKYREKNYRILLNSNGDLEVTYFEKTDIVEKDVLSFYVIHNEINGGSKLYFINYDGSVS